MAVSAGPVGEGRDLEYNIKGYHGEQKTNKLKQQISMKTGQIEFLLNNTIRIGTSETFHPPGAVGRFFLDICLGMYQN